MAAPIGTSPRAAAASASASATLMKSGRLAPAIRFPLFRFKLYFLASPKRSCYLRRAKGQRPHGRRPKKIPAQERAEAGGTASRRRRAEGRQARLCAAKPRRRRAARSLIAKRTPDAAAAAAGERPKRDFKRDDRPRGEGGRAGRGAPKPFRKGPPRDGERKPFVKRADGDRKPFVKREDGDRQAVRQARRRCGVNPMPRALRAASASLMRPGPRAASARSAISAAVRKAPAKVFSAASVRSGAWRVRASPGRRKTLLRRSKSHEGQKRSYGMKSHDDGGKKPFRKPAEAGAEAPGERIAKRLARAGIASRRDAEELIAAGRVKVNGKELASPAFNVMPDDTIEVDGTAIPPIERTRLFLFHKPAGVVTTNRDPEGRKTVFDVLPADLPRLMTIGRLDINTEGLLLLTNDGGLSRVLELPATGWLQALPRARARQGRREGAAGLKDGHRRRRRVLWLDRGDARPRAGLERLADDRPARRQEPRGEEHPGRARPRRVAADPHFLRSVPARRPAGGPCAGDQGPHAARPARRAADRGSRARISSADIVKPVLQQAGEARSRSRVEEVAERPKIMRDGERGTDRRGRADQEPQAPREHPRRGAGQAVDARPGRIRRGDRPERPKFERGEAGARANSATGPIVLRRSDKPGRSRAAERSPNASSGRSSRRASARPMSGWRRAHGRSAPAGRRPKRPKSRRKRAAKKAYRQAGRRQAGFGKPRGDRPRRRPAPDRQAAAQRRKAMRIVGGEFRGRPLATPRTQAIRPTTDRTREAVFNVLAHRFARQAGRRARARPVRRHRRARAGSAVARRFALPVHRGIGRGPRPDPHQCRGVRAARAAPRSSAATRPVSAMPARSQPFGLVFADPPYGKGLGEAALRSARRGGWLLPGALCVVEEAAVGCHSTPGEGFAVLDERGYGDTIIRFIEAA